MQSVDEDGGAILQGHKTHIITALIFIPMLMYDERLNLVTQSSLSCLTWKTYSLWIKYLCFDSLLSGLVVCWPRHRHGRTPHQLEASEAKGLPSISERAPLRQDRAARRLV